MLPRVKFLFIYFCFWLAANLLLKFVLLCYFFGALEELSGFEIAGIFWHGLKLDLSLSAYLSSVPFLLVSISAIINKKVIHTIITTYTYIIVSLISILFVIDIEIFRSWGHRLDLSPFLYLQNPKEAIISSWSSPIFLLSIMLLLIIVSLTYLYKKKISPLLYDFQDTHPIHIFTFLIPLALLIIPIRGGLQQIPINQSDAYFSDKLFANQAAINGPWNFLYALINGTSTKENPYRNLDSKKAMTIVNQIYDKSNTDDDNTKLVHPKPNIILVVWESFTAKSTTTLGGLNGITPQFDSLTKEGILFNQFYASGDRSDRGLVALLSGHPTLPKESIIKYPEKTLNLPSLANSLKSNGYHTSFYYGGELEFANMKSYLYNAQFQEVIGKSSFQKEDLNSKWGAHDHVVFDRLLNDINTIKAPFFSTIFTLSSHEPYDIPITGPLQEGDEESLFLNSLYYADKSLGHFITQAKKQPWYDHTLIIIVADHGHRLPYQSPHYAKEKFHIPMLWLGGAIKQSNMAIDKICSQTDVAATLLSQLEINHNDFKWSNDIFQNRTPSFAQYAFNNGIGHINSTDHIIYDNIGQKLIRKNGKKSDSLSRVSKAHLQVVYEDFLNK